MENIQYSISKKLVSPVSLLTWNKTQLSRSLEEEEGVACKADEREGAVGEAENHLLVDVEAVQRVHRHRVLGARVAQDRVEAGPERVGLDHVFVEAVVEAVLGLEVRNLHDFELSRLRTRLNNIELGSI